MSIIHANSLPTAPCNYSLHTAYPHIYDSLTHSLTHALAHSLRDSDLPVVQMLSNEVWKYFTRAIEGSYSNGPGKLYMDFLSRFLGCARDVTDARYESCLSTSAGGSGSIGVKDTQAGSSTVTYVFY